MPRPLHSKSDGELLAQSGRVASAAQSLVTSLLETFFCFFAEHIEHSALFSLRAHMSWAPSRVWTLWLRGLRGG
jgi:hypothetical protein